MLPDQSTQTCAIDILPPGQVWDSEHVQILPVIRNEIACNRFAMRRGWRGPRWGACTPRSRFESWEGVSFWQYWQCICHDVCAQGSCRWAHPSALGCLVPLLRSGSTPWLASVCVVKSLHQLSCTVILVLAHVRADPSFLTLAQVPVEVLHCRWTPLQRAPASQRRAQQNPMRTSGTCLSRSQRNEAHHACMHACKLCS